ncbi:dipeptidase [Dyadobacter frigoris]|uniref:Membrane dipeptidase n=1 Tax=Dyadobacter frigoris TaxID=2576211 RepID=A0A4U6DD06_9BACT|nr:membrane dipeptidase [Dyadobacter frigoris]TKT92274.1 membrane dipeptidase [Dyadobacter frigoris]GLU53454.1 peptidase M19 [Dyadobacter frigoris]
MKKITISALFLVISISFSCRTKISEEPSEKDVERIHESAITIDTHIDIRDDFDAKGNDAGAETVDQIDLFKLEKGQLDIATLALFADPLRRTPENITLARKQVDSKLAVIEDFVNKHPDKLEFIKSSADIEKTVKEKKHGILLSFLNALSLGKDTSLIEHYYKQGVRLFGFAHAGNNDWTDSSRPSESFGDKPDEAGGLTLTGKLAVPILNRLGIIIDVSQLSSKALTQTLELSKAPVIASHSGLKSVVDNTRNLSDDELKAIADKGGVVHIVAFAAYLKDTVAFKEDYQKKIFEPLGLKAGKDNPKEKLDSAGYAKYKAAYLDFSRNEWRYATLSEYINSVDRAVKLIGIDHVGFSSDFNHGGGVKGYANVGEGLNITRELVKRGYSEEDIKKLWGGNFIRVFKEVEKHAVQKQLLVEAKK